MNNQNRNLRLLFERPAEPLFIPKGEDKVFFQTPSNYIPESYQEFGQELQAQHAAVAASIVPVQSVALPDLTALLRMDRTSNLSFLIKNHRELATMLIEIFLSELKSYEFLNYT
jgi:hypothetical protein